MRVRVSTRGGDAGIGAGCDGIAVAGWQLSVDFLTPESSRPFADEAGFAADAAIRAVAENGWRVCLRAVAKPSAQGA